MTETKQKFYAGETSSMIDGDLYKRQLLWRTARNFGFDHRRAAKDFLPFITGKLSGIPPKTVPFVRQFAGMLRDTA